MLGRRRVICVCCVFLYSLELTGFPSTVGTPSVKSRAATMSLITVFEIKDDMIKYLKPFFNSNLSVKNMPIMDIENQTTK